jgi:hypothetical protein
VFVASLRTAGNCCTSPAPPNTHLLLQPVTPEDVPRQAAQVQRHLSAPSSTRRTAATSALPPPVLDQQGDRLVLVLLSQGRVWPLNSHQRNLHLQHRSNTRGRKHPTATASAAAAACSSTAAPSLLLELPLLLLLLAGLSPCVGPLGWVQRPTTTP